MRESRWPTKIALSFGKRVEGGFFSRENVVHDVLREVRFTIAIGREIKGSMKHHANRGNLPGA